MAQGDFVSAIELLTNAPHNETLTLDLAVAYGRARMLDRAEEVLSRGLEAKSFFFTADAGAGYGVRQRSSLRECGESFREIGTSSSDEC